MSSVLGFTTLVEPTSSVSAAAPASPFDPGMAYLLAQCCGLTYTQFSTGPTGTGSLSLASFSSLVLAGDYAGYTISAANLQPFTASEPIVPPEPSSTSAPTIGPGDFVTVQAGYGVQLTLTPPSSSSSQAETIVVLALRGTRTFEEWIEDAEAFPVAFAPTSAILGADGQGSCHAGFYGVYTIGTDGAIAATKEDVLGSNVSTRASGSLAQQVGQYVTGLSSAANIYVTGHSLGGALASYCALDIAINFASNASSLFMYSFASPRVAVGISDSFGIAIPTLGNQSMLVSSYQSAVPNSWQIVNAADIVPILPPLTTTVGPMTLSCFSVAPNVVSFCVQQGDIGNNHSATLTYIPYAAALAGGF